MITDILDGSDLQNGPPWMKLGIDEWLISQDMCGTSVPEEEHLKPFVISLTITFNLERFTSKSYILL